MTKPLNTPEQPLLERARPRCVVCGEVIGSYEPMILVQDGKPRKTSTAAEREGAWQTGECYHAACYPAP
jgi:hypothetical protein